MGGAVTEAEISVVGNAGLSASPGILRMKRPGTRYWLDDSAGEDSVLAMADAGV